MMKRKMIIDGNLDLKLEKEDRRVTNLTISIMICLNQNLPLEKRLHKNVIRCHSYIFLVEE